MEALAKCSNWQAVTTLRAHFPDQNPDANGNMRALGLHMIANCMCAMVEGCRVEQRVAMNTPNNNFALGSALPDGQFWRHG